MADIAEEAVETAVTGLDIPLRSDPGMPTTVSDDGEYAEVVLDQAGRIVEAVRADGSKFIPRLRVSDFKADLFALESLTVGQETTGSVEDDAYSRMTTDSAGRVAETDATDSNGKTPAWVLRNWRKRSSKALLGVACYGDSLTQGGHGGGVAYPTVLDAAIPVAVTNYGVAGQVSTEVALRNGGLDVWVTVTGNEIPASGPVTVTAILPSGTWRAGSAWSFPGTLSGVAGVLAKSATEVWTFTRSTTGTATPVPVETRFQSTQATTPLVGRILWAGRNNPDQVIVPRDIRAMVADARRAGAPFLVLPILNSSTEASGTSGYNTVAAVNTALANEYGPDFYDLRGYLIRHGLGDAGITPTTDDTTAISEDRIPPSLMADTLHLNAAGYAVVGNRLAAITTQKGWY